MRVRVPLQRHGWWCVSSVSSWVSSSRPQMIVGSASTSTAAVWKKSKRAAGGRPSRHGQAWPDCSCYRVGQTHMGRQWQLTWDNRQDEFCSLFVTPTGELEQGKLQAKLCIEQATESGLLDVIGRPLRFRAYKTLWGIHSQLADLSLEAADYGEALTLLLEGYSMATECTFQKVSIFE